MRCILRVLKEIQDEKLNYNQVDEVKLIKVKTSNQIIGYHPDTLEKHLNINGNYEKIIGA